MVVPCYDEAARLDLPAFARFLDESPLALLNEVPACEWVLGARVRLLGRRIERRAVRHYAGRVFATAASLVLGLPVYDTQCGAKLFRGSALLRDCRAAPFDSRWIFDVELLARFRALTGADAEGVEARVHELPLRRWRDVRGSKVTGGAALRAAELWGIYRTYGRRGRRGRAPRGAPGPRAVAPNEPGPTR